MSAPTAAPHQGLVADVRVDDRLQAVVDAPPGTVTAVIGPNGAGKSTLLGALAGTVAAQGSVVLCGETWTSAARPVRPVRERRVGLVPQDRMLFPHLTVRDNVAFGPRCRGLSRQESRQVAHDWLTRLGVDDLAPRRPGELSGGQAQRVAIARALATGPALLLLDEPFAGLDVTVAAELRLELGRHLAAYDGVTLLVTHDAVDALTLADRVLVLDRGRVAQAGTPQEAAARPATEHVARLVGLNLLREDGLVRTFRPSAVTVSLTEPAGSARHRWAGTVSGLSRHGDAVRLLVTGRHQLLADVTPDAVRELALEPGREVWLSVKATAVESWPQPASMRP